MQDPGTIVSLASVLAWPTVIVFALFVLKRPLSEALGRIVNFRFESGKVKLETVLKGHLSDAALKEVIAYPDEYLVTRDCEVTVLSLLLRGGTGVEEMFDLEQKVRIVRAYQTEFSNVVLSAGGTIESVEPDRLIAFWGAPIPSSTHADDACDAALALIGLGRRVGESLKAFETRLPFIPRTQVILTTATVTAGNIGPDQFPRYSILGEYGYQLNGLLQFARQREEAILMTGFTQRALKKHRAHAQLLEGEVVVRGKSEPISIYALNPDD